MLICVLMCVLECVLNPKSNKVSDKGNILFHDLDILLLDTGGVQVNA